MKPGVYPLGRPVLRPIFNLCQMESNFSADLIYMLSFYNISTEVLLVSVLRGFYPHIDPYYTPSLH